VAYSCGRQYQPLRIGRGKAASDLCGTITQAITWFTNHLHQMAYPTFTQKKMPTGSGVTEAACKVIIKQRMCNSGMNGLMPGQEAYFF
jgi:hypothetical protein